MINLPTNGNPEVKFYSYKELCLASGYERVEYGKRGPYIEFNEDQIILNNFYIPMCEKWRIRSDRAFYIEFRSKCDGYVKLYFQKQTVSYAFYKIGYFYISPTDLKTDVYGNCIKEIEKPNLSLFF